MFYLDLGHSKSQKYRQTIEELYRERIQSKAKLRVCLSKIKIPFYLILVITVKLLSSCVPGVGSGIEFADSPNCAVSNIASLHLLIDIHDL